MHVGTFVYTPKIRDGQDFRDGMEAAMARPRRRALQPSDIEGLEYFDTLVPLLARLKDIGTQRDRAGNRQLFYDQYVCLLLLYFFSPTITSLRALQQASTLEAVQRRLGIRATSLGSFSEAARLFDAGALHQILQELAGKAAPIINRPDDQQLLHLTAVDGSIFRAFPRMAWALWKDSEHRGVKLHLHFDVFCGTPRDAAVTPACGSETDQLRAMLQPGRLYVIDRGYLDRSRSRRSDGGSRSPVELRLLYFAPCAHGDLYVAVRRSHGSCCMEACAKSIDVHQW